MRLKYRFDIVKLDDQTIAVPIGKNVSEFRGVIKMNDTAARILELLKDDANENDIISALLKEYEAPIEVVTESVRRIIREFHERGLLIP